MNEGMISSCKIKPKRFHLVETKETLKSTSDSFSTVTKQLKSHKITRSKMQICSKHLLDAEL